MVFYWGKFWLEVFVPVEGFFHCMEPLLLIERFGDRVIFTIFERISLELLLNSYYSNCKNCIEIPVLE